jgi:hypothetical protein
MPKFTITVVNEEFSSSDTRDCMDFESARKLAVSSALAIGAEQVSAGKPFFGAEVSLHQGKTLISRFVVCSGASPLKIE